MSDPVVFEYPAVICQQTEGSKPTLLFSASCHEIVQWAGLPRKQGDKAEDGGIMESIGFQRDKNDSRLQDFSAFYTEDRNSVQNPILCAARDLREKIEFEPIADGSVLGTVKIRARRLEDIDVVEAMRGVKEYLESRAASLVDKEVPQELVRQLSQQVKELELGAEESGSELAFDDTEMDESDSEEAAAYENEDESGSGTEGLFSDDHIDDFWEQIAARLAAIDLHPGLEESLKGEKVFLGISCRDLIGYLTPAILVDGQHRTVAAVMAYQALKNSDEAKNIIESLSDNGHSHEEVEEKLASKFARKLNVSLLLDDDPAEHVFQFVIVNQKASPISKVLLGTIVSTTLSEPEIANISDRLEAANIPVTNSRIITKLIKDPKSPFFQKVKRGLGTDNKTMLDWAVFSSIVNIFYTLSKGTLYHESSNDYAKLWKQQHLETCGMIKDASGAEEYLAAWQSETWEKVFYIFWAKVKAKLSREDDDSSYAYWGSPKQSNIFNKVTLSILAASFFEFLVTREESIADEDECALLVEKWMSKVNLNYFDREWQLNGLKKDATGIRRQWSKTWSEYRKVGGTLPQAKKFGQPI